MTEFKLTAEVRETNGRKARQAGLVPAVVYGNKVENINIAIDAAAFDKLFKEAGTSNLVDLTVGKDKTFKTLVHDTQLHPVTLRIIHVDFFKVNMKEKIHAEIPLVFVGESKAILDMEGTLITTKDAVEVECMPADLPSEIAVDISVLDDFEKDIRILDLKKIVPAGVEILDEDEDVIVHIEPPRSEEELEALEEAVVEDVSAVEVEAEKKEDEEAESKEKSE